MKIKVFNTSGPFSIKEKIKCQYFETCYKHQKTDMNSKFLITINKDPLSLITFFFIRNGNVNLESDCFHCKTFNKLETIEWTSDWFNSGVVYLFGFRQYSIM